MIDKLTGLVNSPVSLWYFSDMILILFLAFTALASAVGFVWFIYSVARCGGPSVIMRGRLGKPLPAKYK